MNSSPPPEISGIRWNLGEIGEIQEISGKFRGTQWNSVGFCMALNMNSVGIPGGFRGNAGFSRNFGVWGGFGRFGDSKGFCANSQFGARKISLNYFRPTFVFHGYPHRHPV